MYVAVNVTASIVLHTYTVCWYENLPKKKWKSVDRINTKHSDFLVIKAKNPLKFGFQQFHLIFTQLEN